MNASNISDFFSTHQWLVYDNLRHSNIWNTKHKQSNWSKNFVRSFKKGAINCMEFKMLSIGNLMKLLCFCQMHFQFPKTNWIIEDFSAHFGAIEFILHCRGLSKMAGLTCLFCHEDLNIYCSKCTYPTLPYLDSTAKL